LAPPVVLFDVDGTVLTFEGEPPGPGRTALDRAMHELFGLARATEGLRVAGGTDRALARTMLRRAGRQDDDDAIAQVLSRYVAHLEHILRVRCYRPIGAVADVVAALRDRGAVVGLATGNVRDGARLKLTSAGLAPTFDLALGAFGCEAEPRAEIVRLAAERCGAMSTGAPVVVVGDTEHDVRAARAIGARVVGIGTDAESRAELEAAGADAVVDGCDDNLVRAVLAWVMRRP
jgi:phosphoglycolate phosphatase-like HAD superfamily hydrolase